MPTALPDAQTFDWQTSFAVLELLNGIIYDVSELERSKVLNSHAASCMRFIDSYKFIGRFYDATRKDGNTSIFIKDDVFIPRSNT